MLKAGRWVRVVVLVGACILLLAGPAAAYAAKNEKVIERRTTTGLDKALKSAKEVSIGAEGAAVTYNVPGQKGAHTVNIRYAPILDRILPWKTPIATLYWLPVALAVFGLILRAARGLRHRKAVSPQVAQFGERRKSERRKGERRPGERRQDLPGVHAGTDRRTAERRQGERRRGDRRGGFRPALGT